MALNIERSKIIRDTMLHVTTLSRDGDIKDSGYLYFDPAAENLPKDHPMYLKLDLTHQFKLAQFFSAYELEGLTQAATPIHMLNRIVMADGVFIQFAVHFVENNPI